MVSSIYLQVTHQGRPTDKQANKNCCHRLHNGAHGGGCAGLRIPGQLLLLRVVDDLGLDHCAVLLLLLFTQPDPEQVGRDLLQAKGDALRGLGRQGVGEQAVLLGELVMPVRLD